MRLSCIRLVLLVSLLAPGLSYGDAVMEELVRRTEMPPQEVAELLSNCDRSQVHLNFCAYRDAVKADLEMADVLVQKNQSLSNLCRIKLKARQVSWVRSMERSCNKDADMEARQGAVRPMIFALCQAINTEMRTDELRKISDCSSIR